MRTLSGVMNKISNIIPNSSDIPSSTSSESTGKHCTAAVTSESWTDEDAIDVNFTVGSGEVSDPCGC